MSCGPLPFREGERSILGTCRCSGCGHGKFEAEERFESAFNANPAPALICRLEDQQYIRVNPGFIEMTGGAMADLVVEAVGHQEQQFNLATALARNKGRVLYFGIPPDRIDAVAFEPVVRKSLTIHTSVPDDLRPFVTIAMRAIRQGRVNPSRLITHRFPFADLQAAFETYRDRADGAFKVVLDF